MEDESARSNGSAEWPKPAIPNWVVVVSMAVAVLAVSVLLWVLFQKTTGPGEIVHRYYKAAAGGDCDGAYALLSPALQQAQERDSFCSGLDASQGVPSDPKIGSVTLVGPEGMAKEAAVSVDACVGGPPIVWQLEREGDTWLITSLPDTGIAACGLSR